MADCRRFAEFDWCKENEECGLFKPKMMTNADRIRAMTDEELAAGLCELISNCGICPGSHLCTPSGGTAAGLMKWMKQEATQEATDEDIPMDYLEAGGTL